MTENKELAETEPKKYAVPTKWKPEYDTIVELTAAGYTVPEIVPQLDGLMAIATIYRVRKMPQFAEKLKALCSDHPLFRPGLGQLMRFKPDLIEEMVKVALYSGEDAVKFNALKWCLERFPEFSPKYAEVFHPNQQSVNDISEPELKRQTAAAEKLQKVAEVLRSGNPNVIEIEDAEVIEDKGDISEDAKSREYAATP